MLHIILLILKIIGWILLAILGLAVLLICVALFVPFRYRVKAVCEGDLDSLHANARFLWIFHLISGNVSYENKKLDWELRIAWKRIGQVQDEDEEKAPFENKEKVEEEQRTEKEEERDEEKTLAREIPKTLHNGKSDDKIGKREEKKSSFYQKIKYTICRIYDKIKQTIHKICSAIKSLLEKKDKLAEFIADEAHRSALGTVLTELRRLLGFLKPRKLKLWAHFGFEDPANTGYVLAAASMLSPFLGKHTNIQPDFEQEILEGNLFASGKIRGIYFVISLWNLIWNKNVRITFRHIKNIKTWFSN